MSSLIFGIDIIRGSVRSGTIRPHYALVRVEDGEVISEEKNVTRFRLMRYIRTELPEILGVPHPDQAHRRQRRHFPLPPDNAEYQSD